MVEFQPCVEASGWRVNFTIDLWPSSSLSRNHRGLHTDKVELEANRSGYSLDPAITYTALITSQLGQGVSREFTIPNIKAGADLSVASYQTRPSLLPSSLVIALIVSLSFSVLVIAGSLLVFLLSQTCCLYS